MTLVVKIKFEIGSVVYLTTDTEQRVRIICSVRVYGDGDVTYEVACGTMKSEHFWFELSTDKDYILSTTN